MVDNFSNINKTNNHLSSSLPEYKQKPQHMMLEIQVLAWERHENVAGLNRSMESQFSTLDNWIPNSNKQTIKKTCTDLPPLIKNTNYHKNDWQQNHG